MKPLILLDYDGTIHETFRIYEPAVLETVHWLRSQGIEAPVPGPERIASWLGMSTGQMWEDFMPGLSREKKLEAGRHVGGLMDRYLSEASWYPGAEEVLGDLARLGAGLAIVSNCDGSYARAHWEHFRMERFFDCFFPCGAFHGHSKGRVLKAVCEDYAGARLRSPARRAGEGEKEGRRACLYIGDRRSDREAAREAGLPFLGCLYGYGSEEELEGSEGLVRQVAELAEAVKKLLPLPGPPLRQG